jgi:hypothetical protein
MNLQHAGPSGSRNPDLTPESCLNRSISDRPHPRRQIKAIQLPQGKDRKHVSGGTIQDEQNEYESGFAPVSQEDDS